MNGLPGEVGIDVEKRVDPRIAHSDDLRPRHPWQVPACLVGGPGGRLPDDPGLLDRCRDRPAIRVEAARARPRRNDSASDAAAGICLGPVSSSLRMPEVRGIRDVLADVPTRTLRGSRIHFAPARECGQFHLQTGHAQ